MRILFIEDDICTQVSVTEYLRFLYKMDIVRARHGREGLDMLASGEHFDCIILDERMPVMCGGEFLEHYKGPVPIIYSSAYDDGPPKPVSGVVSKPYNIRTLGAMILRLGGQPEDDLTY